MHSYLIQSRFFTREVVKVPHGINNSELITGKAIILGTSLLNV